MKLSGWGNYPAVEGSEIAPESYYDLQELLLNKFSGIPRGLGRSYGDSALASRVLSGRHFDHFKSFDEESGLLECESGVSFEQILHHFVPKGWFPAVTPGTKFVTIGGAIASDVHGKNHHIAGTFCQHVEHLNIALPSGEFVTCSPSVLPELFHATCGGMGLTGFIVSAAFKLIPIESAMIEQTSIKTKDLEETLSLFDSYQEATYSVAWIDCLATGKSLGRSILMLGEHSRSGDLYVSDSESSKSMPFNMPSALLNRYSVRAFNTLYYRRVLRKKSETVLHYDDYFFPLDGIKQWNKLYGDNGFLQYQCVIPKSAGIDGVKSILEKIAKSKYGSFLAVLKAFGKQNNNYLSFPLEGYTLALDMKMADGLLEFLDGLDRVLLDIGGRIYLTKDARMHRDTFLKSYPNIEAFREVRAQHATEKVFNSLQSKRLGI